MIKIIKMRRRSHWLFQPLAMILACTCLTGISSVAYSAERIPMTSSIQKFTDDELRDLVAPIALYPDALLAQVLPASACPLDIVAAYRFSQTARNPSNPPESVTWDSSVVSLLHYPTVLKRMHDDLPWTERLGVAVTYQMADVSDTIQQVRTEAQAAGNLVSNDKQVVVHDRNVITIVPADPQIIYVPTYEPDVIFVRHDSWQPYISFGIGFGSGLWLTNEFDWGYHRISVRNYWHNDRWHPQYGSIYWRPTYRTIPSWYARGAIRVGPTSNYGYRNTWNSRNGRHSGSIQGIKRGYGPSTTIRSGTPSRSLITPRSHNAPLNHVDGLNTPAQQIRRESNRGASSRQRFQPSRPTPSQSRNNRGSVHSNDSQNVMRPSSAQQSQRESSRGASSRGGGRSDENRKR